MADQLEVVGDVAGASAGVVITELNIETPVQTILDLPVQWLLTACAIRSASAGRLLM